MQAWVNTWAFLCVRRIVAWTPTAATSITTLFRFLHLVKDM